MAEPARCPHCGAELPPNSPEGLCVKCLYQAVLQDQGDRHLHVRCPHCHNPIELVDESPLSEIACPTCGSSFSLLGDDQTVPYHGNSHKTIGHFELIDRVGTGAFGTVWKARDTKLDRTVAIKIPRKEQLDSEAAEQFFREARAAAQLKHPNIVAVHEVGREDDTLYIVSDFVEGLSLADWLTGQQLTPREAAELCAKIAEALHHAHENGVVHRDLKPSNIMLRSDLEPHIMDFGLAKREAGEITMTVEGKVLGTPAYMSPEQAKGEAHAADRRSDVYSLGVILFELLTGEQPFRGSMRMLLHQVINDDPPSPRKLNSSVARDLETISLKCLEKEPRRRYQTAKEVGEELRRFLNAEPIQARPVGRLERIWRWSKRHPTTASLSAALVLTLLIATVTGSLMAVHESALRRLAEQRGRTSRAYLYLAEIKLAHQAWKDGEIAKVEEILHTHRPDKGGEDLRGWEWYYLLSLCHRSLFTLEEASAMALSPDGRQLAVGNWQGPGLKPTLSIYDLETGQAVASMHGHTKSICSVAWSPDGKRIASGGNDQTVKVWDRSTNEIICTLAGHENSVHALAWNPAGTRIASGSRDGTIRIWDVAKQEEIARLEHGSGFVDSVAWRPDGQLIVSASPMEGLKTWNVETWTEASQDASLRGIANSVSPYCVAWDADGKRLAVAGLGQDGQPVAIVWDRETKQHLRLHGHRREVMSVAWSHDGAKLATGSFDKTVRIWDAATGQQLMILRGQTGRVDHVAWLPNGRRVVAEGDGVKVWSVTHSQEATTLPMTVLRAHGGRNDISWNANSNEVAAVDAKDNVSIWDISGRLQWSLAGASGPVAWSPDGRHIAVTAQSHGEQGIQQIDVWSASTRKIVAKLNGHRGAVRNLCWSPDGSRLASTSLGWRFIHDGEEVFNVESDRVIRIWDVQAGEEALSIDPGTSDYVDCIAWSPSGREICWGRGERVGIVDAATGRSIRRFSVGNHPKAVAWSPTGDRIVVCFTFNNALGTFDTATGEKRRELKGHTDQVNAVSWNRDGRRIASTSEDGTIRVWDATTGREVFTFAQSTFKRTASGAVQWSPDGQRLTAWQDGTVKIFDASIGFVLEHTVR